MARMTRKQIYITADQEQSLKQRANELGVTEAELIRRGLDAVLEDDDRERRMREWAQIEARIKRIAERVPTGEVYRFNRDEIYDERLQRLLDRHEPADLSP